MGVGIGGQELGMGIFDTYLDRPTSGECLRGDLEQSGRSPSRDRGNDEESSKRALMIASVGD